MAAPTLPTPPATVAEFKARFPRDFKYGSGFDTVTDDDISRAMSDAMTVYNAGLFSVADGWVAFLNASAHFVVVNIQAVGGLQARPEGMGIENQAQGVISGKGISGVSLNYVDPPDRIKNNPILLQFWTTDYGRKYAQAVAVKTIGAMGIVSGPREAE